MVAGCWNDSLLFSALGSISLSNLKPGLGLDVWLEKNQFRVRCCICMYIYRERERLSINLNMRAFNETWFLHPAVGCVCRLGHFPGNQEDARRVISSMGLGYSSYIVGSDPRGS